MRTTLRVRFVPARGEVAGAPLRSGADAEAVTMSKASILVARAFSSSRMSILRLLARLTLCARTDKRNLACPSCLRIGATESVGRCSNGARRVPGTGVRVMFMDCLVENAAMMHLARKQDLKIAVSGAEAEAFVRLRRADLTSLAADAVAEHLGLFDHAQKSYWLALQAQLPH